MRAEAVSPKRGQEWVETAGPFDKLRAGISLRSGQALRFAQDGKSLGSISDLNGFEVML
jgi:hypothetical protein